MMLARTRKMSGEEERSGELRERCTECQNETPRGPGGWEGSARPHGPRPATKERRHAGRGGRGEVVSYVQSLEGQVEPSGPMQRCGEGGRHADLGG